MIKSSENSCDVIICHNCKTVFEEWDSVYSISKNICYNRQVQSVSSYCPETETSIAKVIHFCQQCFLEIAGENYLIE
jgi:ABC-type Mn2+/Zn2+ transport system ATPase subunit